MEQTAVEWLKSELDFLERYMNKEDIDSLFKRAKAMEKEQIMDSFNNGYNAGWAMSNEYCIIDEDEEEMIYNCEEYYNKTYK
jgi:hypothetical protein